MTRVLAETLPAVACRTRKLLMQRRLGLAPEMARFMLHKIHDYRSAPQEEFGLG